MICGEFGTSVIKSQKEIPEIRLNSEFPGWFSSFKLAPSERNLNDIV
jgi:hypothetical protein